MKAAKKPGPTGDQYVSRKGGATVVVEAYRKLTKGRPSMTSRELARAFVDYSRPKSSPTHAMFEWDDRKVAEQARIDRASTILASVRVIMHEQPDLPPVQWIPTVIMGGVQGRHEIREVMKSGDTMAALVERALAEAQAWVRRHERLRDVARLAGVFSAIETAAKKRRS